ncbi:hypothetical protein [Pontibacter harenae]|uniref:hypothetical protein n=1 Tax=Pontibacter harenae TaxID=2894083 RepID=UPI001E529C21|nr:hypothetical protein [Pontibacter harenae]MCC9167433.1 hypothetical protein [Pontibacter harenae]
MKKIATLLFALLLIGASAPETFAAEMSALEISKDLGNIFSSDGGRNYKKYNKRKKTILRRNRHKQRKFNRSCAA